LKAMPIEIVVKKNMNGHRILDFDVKKDDEETVIAVTDIKIFNKLSKLAKISFKALGGKSLGRIDIKMNHRGTPHFMEANLMPGLRKGYFYRSCVLNLDMSYEDMIFSIANTGLSSH
jgi:D-alanine-D-alanine ligase